MHQQNDFDMASMITYLKSGTLPDDEKLSHRIVLESKQFELVMMSCGVSWSQKNFGLHCWQRHIRDFSLDISVREGYMIV